MCVVATNSPPGQLGPSPAAAAPQRLPGGGQGSCPGSGSMTNQHCHGSHHSSSPTACAAALRTCDRHLFEQLSPRVQSMLQRMSVTCESGVNDWCSMHAFEQTVIGEMREGTQTVLGLKCVRCPHSTSKSSKQGRGHRFEPEGCRISYLQGTVSRATHYW